MEITVLVKLLFFFISVLAVLMVFFFMSAKAKKRKLLQEHNKRKEKEQKALRLESLRDQMKDKKISSQELKKILDTVLQMHGTIEDFDIYLDIIYRMTRHPSATKDIVLSFERDLSKLNPKHKGTISKSVMDGVSSRVAN